MSFTSNAEQVIAATRTWIERAVIGLNLCPFAKAVYVKEQIRYVVSECTTPDELLLHLEQELRWLADADPEDTDTTLLIHPQVLTGFVAYNKFLGRANGLINKLDLEGVIQIASFHPEYRFAGSSPEDVTNYTNRSPFPMLHLLRESSVARAVAAFPDASKIYQRNMETMQQLGISGWNALMAFDLRTPPK